MRHSEPKVIAFRGINTFNITFDLPNWHLIDYNNNLKEQADIFFQTNVMKRKTSSFPEYNYIKESNKPVLVCESNIFRKNSYPITDNRCYFRLGWNHFLRTGNFNNENCPPDRWNYIKNLQNLKLKKWRLSGEYILLVLQKPTDSTLNSLYKVHDSYVEWIEQTISNLRKVTNRHIRIRPHLNTAKLNYKKFESRENNVSISSVFKERSILEGGKSLEEDFKNAWAVVGYNSNSLVESTLEGIPTFPLSEESVVWDVSNKDNISNIETPLLDIDRTQWCYNSAYMMWTKKEISDGTAWDHLKGVYFGKPSLV